MNLVRKRRRSGGMTVLPAAFWCFVLVIVTGCASDSTTSPGEDITTVVAGQGMDVPAEIAVRPDNDGELWVTNRGSDSQAVGWALYERMVFDEQGRVVNPTFRNYRIPAFADTPRTEVFFADTYDAIGPLGAKGMGECPVNPVAPALANALADATGVRFRDLPFTPDRIYRHIFERHTV